MLTSLPITHRVTSSDFSEELQGGQQSALLLLFLQPPSAAWAELQRHNNAQQRR